MLNRLILIAILSWGLSQAQGANSDLTLEQAKECLTTTQPNTSAIWAAQILSTPGAPQTAKIIELNNTYDRQWAAIDRLASDQELDIIKILIPYLGYTHNARCLYFGPPKNEKEDICETKKDFPVFAIILSMPGSASVLADYCLDPKNPSDYRMTALLVLRYVDINKFKDIVDNFNKKFPINDQLTQIFVTNIENGKQKFWGPIRTHL